MDIVAVCCKSCSSNHFYTGTKLQALNVGEKRAFKIRKMTIEDYEKVYQLWMSYVGTVRENLIYRNRALTDIITFDT